MAFRKEHAMMDVHADMSLELERRLLPIADRARTAIPYRLVNRRITSIFSATDDVKTRFPS